MPESEFQNKFYSRFDIDNLAETYKLSKIFIFYRLKDLGKINKSDQEKLEAEIKKETEENILRSKDNKGGGGDYNNNMKDSNGNLFNKIISSDQEKSFGRDIRRAISLFDFVIVIIGSFRNFS